MQRWINELDDDRLIISEMFVAALSRSPTVQEQKALNEHVSNKRHEAGDDATKLKSARREALEDIFWVVLNSTDFMFQH